MVFLYDGLLLNLFKEGILFVLYFGLYEYVKDILF